MHVGIVCDCPENVLVHKPSWVADGFRARGHTVELAHDLASIRRAEEHCDLLVFDHKAAGVSRATLVQLSRQPRRAVWVQWWRDLIATHPQARLVDQPFLRSFGDVMRGMDLVLVKERSLLADYHQLGINAVWLDQACPADMPPCQHAEQPEWDVLVLGSTSYDQRRHDARSLAAAGFRVLWAGLPGSDPVPEGIEWHPWMHPLALPDLVSRCGVVLAVDYRCDLPGYTSDRTWLAAGMGACYIARYVDCGHDVPPASYAPQAEVAAWLYDDTQSLIRVVRTALGDVSERRRRGAWARQQVMDRHTYSHRAERIVEIVGSGQ
jgi:hypothetical protein